jgi:hypothetical protein
VQVFLEVDQQDVFAKVLERRIGVARQPVVDDLFLGFHGALPGSCCVSLLILPDIAQSLHKTLTTSCRTGASVLWIIYFTFLLED